jgi:hypothetical protein
MSDRIFRDTWVHIAQGRVFNFGKLCCVHNKFLSHALQTAGLEYENGRNLNRVLDSTDVKSLEQR